MINSDLLRGVIAAKGLSQRKVAKYIGISEKTFYEKMKKGVFDSTEMEAMIKLLKIENPINIFFPSFVAYKETEETEE